MRPELEVVREWLVKAQNDLASAKLLLTSEVPIRDTGCFHCQQTVEKAFKAFLTFHTVEFEKSHSLVYLLDLCARVEEDFVVLRDVASGLTV
jgi:HEPN domain-containing protein